MPVAKLLKKLWFDRRSRQTLERKVKPISLSHFVADSEIAVI